MRRRGHRRHHGANGPAKAGVEAPFLSPERYSPLDTNRDGPYPDRETPAPHDCSIVRCLPRPDE